MLVSLPVLLGVEHAAPPPLPRFPGAYNYRDRCATQKAVWKRLIEFPPASHRPRNGHSGLGIAYPIEARIKGEGSDR